MEKKKILENSSINSQKKKKAFFFLEKKPIKKSLRNKFSSAVEKKSRFPAECFSFFDK